MRIIRDAVYWLFACCLPVLLLTSTIRCEVNSLSLYEYGFDKYEISEATGINSLQLRDVATRLIDYFDGRTDTPQISVARAGEEFGLFNERELIHLRDVRNLIQLDYRVQYVALFLMVASVLVLLFVFGVKWRRLLKGLFWGGIITAALVVVLALWAAIGFERFFILFHVVSFPNEYWMLNPSEDYLIMLFPEGFFYDAALFGFVAILIEALVVVGVTIGILRFVPGNKGRLAEKSKT